MIRTGLKVSLHSCFQGWLAYGQDLCDPKPDDWVTGLAYKKSGFKSLLCLKQSWLFFFCSKPLLCFNLSDLNLGLHVPNAIPQPSGYGIFVLRWKHFYLNLSFADKETYEIIFVWWRSVLRWNEFLENRTIQQLVLWSCPLPCLKYTQIGRAIGTWDHPWPRIIFKRRSTKQLQVK